MSQEKVDRYKEEKKNRKTELKKQKRKQKAWKLLGPVLILLVIALIGAGAYFIPQWTTQYAEENSGDEIDYDQLMQLINQSAAQSDVNTENNTGDTNVTSETDN